MISGSDGWIVVYVVVAYLWMYAFNEGKGLGGELWDERAILDGVILAHCASDCDASRVNNDNALEEILC